MSDYLDQQRHLEKTTFVCRRPKLVKLSPDVTYQSLSDVLEVCERHGIDGYVCCNTSSKRDGLRTSKGRLAEIGAGGLSGPPVRKSSTEVVGIVRSVLPKTYIIGLGGIDSADAAYEKIRAGADAVQIYTGLVYKGPGLVKRINKGLVKRLERDGYSNIKEAVGDGKT